LRRYLNIQDWEDIWLSNIEKLSEYPRLRRYINIQDWEDIWISKIEKLFEYPRLRSYLNIQDWEVIWISKIEKLFEYPRLRRYLNIQGWEDIWISKIEKLFEYPSIYISSSVWFRSINTELLTKDERVKPTWNSLNMTITRFNYIFCLTYSFVWHFNSWENQVYSCRES